jgi:uncharacterized OB-fold protein
MAKEKEYKKPLPRITPLTKPFWEATKRHEILIQHCNDCGKNIFPPKPRCTKCGSTNLSWIKSSGRGKIYTYTVVYRGAPPEFQEDVPYVVALVELEEGVRFPTRIIDSKPEDLKIGLEVEPVFHDVTDEITLVYFRPVKSKSA